MYLCGPILSKYFVGFSVAILRLHLSSMVTTQDPHGSMGRKKSSLIKNSYDVRIIPKIFPRYSPLKCLVVF